MNTQQNKKYTVSLNPDKATQIITINGMPGYYRVTHLSQANQLGEHKEQSENQYADFVTKDYLEDVLEKLLSKAT